MQGSLPEMNENRFKNKTDKFNIHLLKYSVNCYKSCRFKSQ